MLGAGAGAVGGAAKLCWTLVLCGRDGMPKALKSKGSFLDGGGFNAGCGAEAVEVPEKALVPVRLLDERRLAHGSGAWEVVLIEVELGRAAD